MARARREGAAHARREADAGTRTAGGDGVRAEEGRDALCGEKDWWQRGAGGGRRRPARGWRAVTACARRKGAVPCAAWELAGVRSLGGGAACAQGGRRPPRGGLVATVANAGDLTGARKEAEASGGQHRRSSPANACIFVLCR